MVPRGAGRNGKQEGASPFLLQLCSAPAGQGSKEAGGRGEKEFTEPHCGPKPSADSRLGAQTVA